QRELLKTGQFIPELVLQDERDLVQHAHITASGTLNRLEFDDEDLIWKPLVISTAQLIPFGKGQVPAITLTIEADRNTELDVALRLSARKGGFTPDTTLVEKKLPVSKGRHEISLSFDVQLNEMRYVFLTFLKNPHISLPYTHQRVTGLLSVYNGTNKRVSNNGHQ